MSTPNPLEQFPTGDLVNYYAEYRAQLERISADADARSEKPKKMLAAIEGELLRRASVDGVKSFPCDSGTFSIVTTSRYNISDPVKWQDFIFSEKDLSYFGKAVNKTAVETYQKEHGEIPPGIGTHQQMSIRFTAKK